MTHVLVHVVVWASMGILFSWAGVALGMLLTLAWLCSKALNKPRH